MEAKLFKNGQSMAIRLPARWLKEGEFADSVELELKKDGSILIKPSKVSPREGWAEAVSKIAAHTPEDDSWAEAGVEDGLEDFQW